LIWKAIPKINTPIVYHKVDYIININMETDEIEHTFKTMNGERVIFVDLEIALHII